MGRRDPAFLTSLRYFFSFFSHFLEALTICFDVIFMLMSSSCKETRWPMVALVALGVGKSLEGMLSVEHFCSVRRRLYSLGGVALDQTQQSRCVRPGRRCRRTHGKLFWAKLFGII